MMTRRWLTVLYIVVLIAVIVCVDVLFFKHHTMKRLFVNVGIAAICSAFGWRYLRKQP